ncbi:MAG: PAS domain-containing protein [Burkholderiales bacterium]
MPEPSAPPSSAAPPSAALLAAWLAQSHDLLALTDAAGVISWCNPAFERATGLGIATELLALAPGDAPHAAARAMLDTALREGRLGDTELALQSNSGTPLWISARVTRVGDDRLWTLRNTTAQHELAVRAQHLSELLDMAQEFGRLGVWEREIPSGTGRWDRHVFGFWGISPDGGTPDYPLAASRVHEEDRTSYYLDSTRQAGRYAQHYRVMHADGSMRRIHSQWEVRNSAQGVPDRVIGIMVDDTEVYELARSRDRTAAQLKLATELADIVIWRHDLKTERIQYNDHGFKVLGIPHRPGGLSLAEARSRTHPDDVHKLAASSAHALATGVPIDVEVRHRRDDGAWRYMLVRRVIERDAAGEVIAFVGVTLDVTSQVEQARRAEQLARRLEAAAEAARIGVWTTVIGTRQTEWNAQMYELFDLVDSGEAPTLGEWIGRCVHPEDVRRVTRTTRAFLKRETRAFEIEFRTRMRDGRTRWMVLRADLDRSGTDPARVFGIAMDVTERHDALDALHAASERAALIARHAGIGTWETDEPGRRALWDEQMWQLRGLAPRPQPLTREERLALTHPDDRAHVLDANPQLNDSASATAYEFRVRMPDGSYRWLASRSAVLLDERGKVMRRVGVNWDITEAKNAELARQQALLAERENEAKSQFLSRMSHELRTPLNAVLGFTQLLQLEADQGGAQDRAVKLDHIRAAGEHLLTLIDDALDLSSLQAGRLRLDLQAVPLASAVAQALPLVGELAAAHHVTLRVGALPGAAHADPTRLCQVLLNLLTNAIKYNRAGGEVSLDASAAGDQIRLNVRDTGRGMTPKQLGQLFEPFNRLGIESEGIEGSGIGLTISRALVEGMGGRIEVSSEAGHGTVFEVTLPQAAQPATPLEAPAQRPAAARTGRSGQLLYIEDNAVNVLLVEELVKHLPGLRMASEPTGGAGVARARVLRPDLILVDMQLPDFDGFEVLRRLRGLPETAATRCIALSANAMPDDIARGLAAGFDDYWTKPIRFAPLLDALDRLFPPAPTDR